MFAGPRNSRRGSKPDAVAVVVTAVMDVAVCESWDAPVVQEIEEPEAEETHQKVEETKNNLETPRKDEEEEEDSFFAATLKRFQAFFATKPEETNHLVERVAHAGRINNRIKP